MPDRSKPGQLPLSTASGSISESPVAETEIALICEAEVKNLDHAVGADFDVRGFEITMNDALFMRGFEGLGDLARDGQGLGDGAPRAM